MDDRTLQMLKESTLSQLEAMVKEAGEDRFEALNKQVQILDYIRTANRWKEDRRYAKSSFVTYLEDKFLMRIGTFHEQLYAVTKFPTATREFGVGLVSKVRKVCGSLKVREVLGLLLSEKAKSDGPFTRSKIENIIQKNRTVPKKEREHTDWKGMYEGELVDHEKTRTLLVEANKEVEALREQIRKLKVIAVRYNKIRGLAQATV